MTACPECGARDGRCEAQFDRLLALEYADSAHGAVHHLTVTTYMLQHSSRLTPEGWLFERDLLRRFLEEGAEPQQIRREIGRRLDSRQRKFKIRSVRGRPLHHRCNWTRTILDVRAHPARSYCEDVVAWARATLVDCEGVALERHEA